MRPPSRKSTRNPTANSIGVVERRCCPPHIVPIQLKNFTPVGTAIRHDSPVKNGDRHRAGGEHVVGPHADRQRGDGERGEDDARRSRTPAGARTPGSTSVTTPKNGSAAMYTSGWPKNQNRCCHRIGDRRRRRRRRCGRRGGGRRTASHDALVSTGKAMSTSTLVTSMFQVKIGMRNIDMPGARMVEHGGDDVHRGEHAGQAGEHDAPSATGRPPTAGERTTVGQRRVGGPAEVGRRRRR